AAPYPGRALAVDTNGNVYVTGFSEVDFATVKLNPMGSNVWLRTYDRAGCIDVSQRIALDSTGNAYVGGTEKFICNDPLNNYGNFALLRYDTNGAQQWVWHSGNIQRGDRSSIKGIAVDNAASRVYFTGNSFGDHLTYATVAFDLDGNAKWS